MLINGIIKWVGTEGGYEPWFLTLVILETNKSESFHQICKKWTFYENSH